MSAGIKMKTHLQLDPVQKIKLRHLINKDGKAQRFFTLQVHRMSEPYTPRKDGPLIDTSVEGDHTITYVQPYSSKNYYENRGNGMQATAHNGLRGKLWDKRMWADHGDEIIEGVANYVGGRADR